MSQKYSGFIQDDAGAAIQSATVNLYDRGTTTPSRANTTTDAAGFWSITHATEGQFDVKIAKDSWVRWLFYDDALTVEELEANVLRIRGTDNAFALIIQHTASAERTAVYADQNLFHPQTKIKASTETITNSTSMHDDADLVFPVLAGERYVVDYYLRYSAEATPDIKFGFSVPTDAGLSGVISSGMVSAGSSHIDQATVIALAGAAVHNVGVHITGSVTVSSTPGNIALQWAQNTSDAGNTSVLTGSALVARRIS